MRRGGARAPDRIFVAHGGLETFADVLAYEFLERVGGWWVDNDVVCNTDVPPDVPIAFAEERPGIINNAVLKFPAHHAAMRSVLAHVASVDPVTSPWGSTGPLALSAVLRQHQLATYQRPTADFYPFHWKEAAKVLFPEFTEEIDHPYHRFTIRASLGRSTERSGIRLQTLAATSGFLPGSAISPPS